MWTKEQLEAARKEATDCPNCGGYGYLCRNISEDLKSFNKVSCPYCSGTGKNPHPNETLLAACDEIQQLQKRLITMERKRR